MTIVSSRDFKKDRYRLSVFWKSWLSNQLRESSTPRGYLQWGFPSQMHPVFWDWGPKGPDRMVWGRCGWQGFLSWRDAGGWWPYWQDQWWRTGWDVKTTLAAKTLPFQPSPIEEDGWDSITESHIKYRDYFLKGKGERLIRHWCGFHLSGVPIW